MSKYSENNRSMKKIKHDKCIENDRGDYLNSMFKSLSWIHCPGYIKSKEPTLYPAGT